MENKITTSIQYQLSNGKLFQEVFGNWRKFNEELKKGPENMRQWLFDKWNEVKEELQPNPNIVLKDFEREVTKEDFDISFQQTKQGTNIFFFVFPDYDGTDAASKYVALVLAPKMPRYFALEYSQSFVTKKKQYVIGEFVIDQKTHQKAHLNYGSIDNDRLSYFAGYLLEMIEGEEENENRN